MIFTLMAVGFFAHKWNLIHESGAKDMTKISLYIASPGVFTRKQTGENHETHGSSNLALYSKVQQKQVSKNGQTI
jgi:predicted permease